MCEIHIKASVNQLNEPPSRKRELKKTSLAYYRRCLRCGKVTTDANYVCNCEDAAWTNEYRLTELNYTLTSEDIERALEAFRSYNLDSREGMMQYPLLPHRSFAHRLKLRIGATPMFNLPSLSHLYKRELYIKDEGKNPGGSFKDRETAMAALNSLALGYEGAIIYSSGNAAASAALIANHLNIQLITCVPGDTYDEKVDYIRKQGSDVVRIGNKKTNYEEGYRLFAQLNCEGFFTSRGLDNWSVRNPFRIAGDKTTALEVIRQFCNHLGQEDVVPDYVVVPTGNGSCLAGMWKGFLELKKIGAINKLPKMVSAAIKNASPVYQAFHRGKHRSPEVCDLNKVDESDLEIGSVIIAEEGYDSVAATTALYESGGTAMVVTRREVKAALTDLLESEWATTEANDFLPEPASLVGLAAVAKMERMKIGENGSSVVAVITGHGSKALKLMKTLLSDRPELRDKMLSLATLNRKNDNSKVVGHNPGQLQNIAVNKIELEEAVDQLHSTLKKTITIENA